MKKISLIIFVITFILVVIAIGQQSNQRLLRKTANVVKTDIPKGLVQPAQSNIKPVSDQNIVNCDNFLTRTEIEACLSNELNKLNSKLNDEIKGYSRDIKAFYTSKDLSNLNKSQKLWLAYRLENCQAEKELYGEGTDAVTAGLSCEIKLTVERDEELRRIYGSK